MARSGPAPKPDDERIRRNKDTFEAFKVDLDWDMSVARGPELPKDIGISWCPKTRQWWDAWRRSPQAVVMAEVDWEYMLETAMLHNEFWSPKIVSSGGKLIQVSKSSAELTNLAKEIRQRLSAYGGTYEDRLKLRMNLNPPQTKAEKEALMAAEAKEMVDYLSRLNKKVAEG